MNSLMFLQVSENVIRKSAEMAVKDPHGIIITVVSVAVVFIALVILYFAYTFVGKVVGGKFSIKGIFRRRKKPADRSVPSPEEAAAIALALDQELGGETYAAIGLALHQYLNDTVHDMESYIITIKRK
jgi:sodium pump decarboxylase gamma subunit